MTNQVGRIRTMHRSNCRGGSHPPARYQPTASNQSGRIRTIPNIIPLNETLNFVSWRAAASRPYEFIQPHTIQRTVQIPVAGQSPEQQSNKRSYEPQKVVGIVAGNAIEYG